VLSDFGAVSIVRVEVFTHAIFTSLNLGFDRTGALVLATVLVLLTVALLVGEGLTRRRGARYTRGGVRGHTRVPLGRLRFAALFGLCLLALGSLGVPLFSLARWFGAGVTRPGSVAEVVTAAGQSLWAATLGACLTLLLALPIGLLNARSPGPIATTLDRLSYVSHALPGLVIGLSLVFFGIRVVYPLYQTVWLLSLAYAALFLPLAVGAVSSAAAQSPAVLEEVARSLGRGPWTVARTVTLPLAAPGIGAGTALVFLTCMKELPATLLLRPTGYDTLATELWTYTNTSDFAGAAPYAAILVLIAAIPVWALIRHG